MAKVIVITSGKGGVGKTTSAINIAAGLNYFNKEVIVVDANLTTPNIGLHLGAPMVPVSLNHVLNGKAMVNDAIYEHESGMKVILSSLSVKELRKLTNNGKLKDIGKRLKKLADFVIFDSAAGLGDEALAALEAADDIIIVTNPEIPAVTDALKTAKVVESLGKEVKGVIVTRVGGRRKEMPVSNIRDMLELPILGVIPEDKNVPRSVNMKDALVNIYPRSRAARAYKKLAAKLIGKDDYREEGFLARLFG